MEGRQEDLVRQLPDDALAAVLRRLAPRDLAVSRCVRKAWHAIIDDRRLLLPHLLPHKVGGIFIEFNNFDSVEFFARPTTGTAVSGELDFLPPELGPDIHDHCNGLCLGYKCVFNPATRRWTPLPPSPAPLMKRGYFYHDEYLVFDPTISPHYEVLSIPRISYKSSPGDFMYHHTHELDPSIEESEWPPSRCVLHAFSSKIGQWAERPFLRIGHAMGTVSDMRKDFLSCMKRYAAYWQGELYVLCEANFVIRISLSNNKYRIIKPPAGVDVSTKPEALYLGKSEKGVYCALVDYSDQIFQLRVWTLQKSCDQMEWVLMHQANLGSILARKKHDRQINGPWILNDINYRQRCGGGKIVVQQTLEWDSDNDNVVQVEAGVEYEEYVDFLGFHPYKEVVFLSESHRRGVAYHLNSLKVQELGNLYPTNYGHIAGQHQLIRQAFPYTPCWMGECPPGE
ncbi:unnamed protein product [Urochloa humidicola]